MTPGDLSGDQILLAVVTGLLGSASVGSIIVGFMNRKKTKVEVAASVVALLRGEMEAAQTDAQEARDEARKAREEATKAREVAHSTVVKMYEIQQQAELLAYRLRRLTGAILDLNVSREELMDMARASQGGSGN